MAEKMHGKIESSHEQLKSLETDAKGKLERLKEVAESQEHDHNLTKIHESIHKEAVSAKEITVGELQENTHQQISGVQKELRADAYRRTMKKLRSRLNPADRALSKVIHNSKIEPLSEFSSKTVARPSAILGGGIAALAGSGVVLYMAKYYGFRYNFTIFFVLLIGGFMTGLAVEAVIKLLRR